MLRASTVDDLLVSDAEAESLLDRITNDIDCIVMDCDGEDGRARRPIVRRPCRLSCAV